MTSEEDSSMKCRLARIALLLVAGGCTASGSSDKSKGNSLTEQAFAAWNAHDPDKVVVFYADSALYEDVTYGMVAHGRAELRKLAADFFAAVPDLKLEATSVTGENGPGAVEWVFSGTDVGLYKTGKKFSVRGASVFEIRGGKVYGNRDYYDSAAIMRQVGVLPAPKS
jgi:steroid delta-isomerase-like uncharacterized protein